MRLIPIVPFSLFSIAAGAAKVPIWRFAWTTFVGYLPITIIFVYLGSQLEELSPTDPILWASAVALVAMMLGVRPTLRLDAESSALSDDSRRLRRLCPGAASSPVLVEVRARLLADQQVRARQAEDPSRGAQRLARPLVHRERVDVVDDEAVAEAEARLDVVDDVAAGAEGVGGDPVRLAGRRRRRSAKRARSPGPRRAR